MTRSAALRLCLVLGLLAECVASREVPSKDIAPNIASPPCAVQSTFDEPCSVLSRSLDCGKEMEREGRRTAAEALYRQILYRARAEGCRLQEARAHNSISIVEMHDGDLVESLRGLDASRQILATVEPSKNHSDLWVDVESNLGNVLFRLGRFDLSNDVLHRALVKASSAGSGDSTRSRILLHKSRASRLLGRIDAAEGHIDEALALDGRDLRRSEHAALWQEKARVAIENRRFDEAYRVLLQAIQVLDDNDVVARANIMADQAEVEVARRRWSRGLKITDEALSLAADLKIKDLNLLAHLRYVRSMTLAGGGDVKEAKRSADEGLDLLESLRGDWRSPEFAFFAVRQKYYRHRFDLAALEGLSGEAWKVFESYRARGLLASLTDRPTRDSESTAGLPTSRTRELRHALLQAAWRVDQWTVEMGLDVRRYRHAVLRDQSSALQRHRVEQRRNAGWRSPSKLLGVHEISQQLDEESLALAYVQGSHDIYLLTLDAYGRSEQHRLEAEPVSLRKQVEQLRRCVEGSRNDEGNRCAAVAGQVGQVLLGPLRGRLENYRRLIVVLGAGFEWMPFAALDVPGAGKPLVSSHEIVHVPSFSVLAESRRRLDSCSPPADRALLLGDPIFGQRDSRWPANVPSPRSLEEDLRFRPLPGSRHEVKYIGDLYGSQASSFVGEESTAQRFLREAPKHRVLHIASHAQSHTGSPDLSKIALSCINQQGDVVAVCDLHFQRLATLELCGQVVVLSACGTAVGPSVAGEGVLGLPRALMQSGAAAIVASLWQVEDGASADLMVRFHRHLRGGSRVAEALRTAQLELLEEGASSADWAAFIVFGDWRPGMPDASFSTSSPESGLMN